MSSRPVRLKQTEFDSYHYTGMTQDFLEWCGKHGFEKYDMPYSNSCAAITSSHTGWIELDFWGGEGYLTIDERGVIQKWHKEDFERKFDYV